MRSGGSVKVAETGMMPGWAVYVTDAGMIIKRIFN